MPTTLIVGEINDGKLNKNSFDLLKISDKISDQTSLVLCTSSKDNISLDEIKILPVDFIYLLKTPSLDIDHGIYDIDTHALSVLLNSKDFNLILFSKSEYGSVVAPRVAFRNKRKYLSDCTGISLEGGIFSIERPIYGGVANAEYELSANISPVFSIRPGLQDLDDISNNKIAEIEEIEIELVIGIILIIGPESDVVRKSMTNDLPNFGKKTVITSEFLIYLNTSFISSPYPTSIIYLQ